MTGNKPRNSLDETPFWQTLSDPMEASVYFGLHWLTYVYPMSAIHLEKTLTSTLPYADAELSQKWSTFLQEQDVEAHVDALTWLSKTLSKEQQPFLVEACWRLLLIDHDLPTYLPLALRILSKVLKLKESVIYDIGDRVFKDILENDAEHNYAPLLPVDPRYLDRIEWRLYGDTIPTRQINETPANTPTRQRRGWGGFLMGTVFGGVLTSVLVFGPLQLGRTRIPTVVFDDRPVEQSVVVDSAVPPATLIETNVAESDQLQAAETAEVVDTAEVVEKQDAVAVPAVDPGILMVVNASQLNIRIKPIINSAIVARLNRGAEVVGYPDEADGLWMKVVVDGKTGYASSRFLTDVKVK